MIKNSETVNIDMFMIPENVLSEIRDLPHVYSAEFENCKFYVLEKSTGKIKSSVGHFQFGQIHLLSGDIGRYADVVAAIYSFAIQSNSYYIDAGPAKQIHGHNGLGFLKAGS